MEHTELEFERKKDASIEALGRGLNIRKALVLAGLSYQEQDQLLHDDVFLARVEYAKIKYEKYLLDMFEIGSREAISKGSTQSIQWMLGKIDPDEWGNKKVDVSDPGQIIFDAEDKNLL